ncbi:hypothetical protein ONS95_004597 [Cadophora gregata]|uniref:uncharacterized protein n=1 Tax=Cadophora gregata TaxID=51156 RepID=UPI0026DC9B16|nr:uncharacterized protein ONS95_004597 [Cadophora gregata]KAK0105035.1 hypothetical protein ONS96_004440 [Cadophora gregata f. sp. sojae]KAK0106093.1 hypothetical protein ONS95_004597 [Cadophora gregata]
MASHSQSQISPPTPASPPTPISIKPLTSSAEDLNTLSTLWSQIFPQWPIEDDLLGTIIRHPLFEGQGRHFLAFENQFQSQSQFQPSNSPEEKPVGFILTYLSLGNEDGKTKTKKRYISAIGVLPTHRERGVGGALLKRGVGALRGGVGERDGDGDGHGDGDGEGEMEKIKIVIGSETPRFWPGLPVEFTLGEGESVGVWLGRRGFNKSNGPNIKDFFKGVRTEVVSPNVKERVEKIVKEEGLRFAPWDESGYEECMEKQNANFSWANAYAVLASLNLYHEVLVAFDAETNQQLGWTLMCGPDASVKDMFAFLPLAGDVAFEAEAAEKDEGSKVKRGIGLISAVGIDAKARGRGVGLAMVVRAMENLKERGVDGIFIDSAVIKGFYEKIGFETRWEYENWEFIGTGEEESG